MTNYAGVRHRVVILGGGFAGAYAARKLQKTVPKDWEVTLIDRNNFLLFYPLLVEAGVGSLEPRHVVVPLRHFLPTGDYRRAEVIGVYLDQKIVRFKVVGVDEPETIPYDHLVLAVGSVTKLPPIPGLDQHGFELKSLSDAVMLRDRGIHLLEIANATSDAEARRRALRIVVVGANFTGIEFAGEFQDFLVDAARAYSNVDREDISVVVFEAASRILPALDEELADFAQAHLVKRGLDIRTSESILSVSAEGVETTNGEPLATNTVVWCAGIAPNPICDAILGLPRDEKGWVLCSPDLRVKGHQSVWAAGDIAKVERPDGTSYAATAQVATRQGEHVAKNIVRSVEGATPDEFDYGDAGSIAALGCRTAVAKVFGIRLAGFLAWWLYRTVYLMKMPSFSRKVRVALDWTLELFFKRETVQLGLAEHGSRR